MVKTRAERILLFIVLAAAIGWAVFLLLRQLPQVVNLGHAKYFGVMTDAIVTDKMWKSSEGRRVQYAFATIDGRLVSNRVPVGDRSYTALEIGDSIAIRYLPGDPEVSVLSQGDRAFAGSIFYLALTVIFLTIVAYAFFKAYTITRRQRAV